MSTGSYQPSEAFPRTKIGYFYYLRSRIHRRDEFCRTLILLRRHFPNARRALLRRAAFIESLCYSSVPPVVVEAYLKDFLRILLRWERYRVCFLNSN